MWDSSSRGIERTAPSAAPRRSPFPLAVRVVDDRGRTSQDLGDGDEQPEIAQLLDEMELGEAAPGLGADEEASLAAALTRGMLLADDEADAAGAAAEAAAEAAEEAEEEEDAAGEEVEGSEDEEAAMERRAWAEVLAQDRSERALVAEGSADAAAGSDGGGEAAAAAGEDKGEFTQLPVDAAARGGGREDAAAAGSGGDSGGFDELGELTAYIAAAKDEKFAERWRQHQQEPELQQQNWQEQQQRAGSALPSPALLAKRMEVQDEGGAAEVLLYYCYKPTNAAAECCWQRKVCERLELTGRVRVASEGINGTLCGAAAALQEYSAEMESEGWHAIDWKFSAVDVAGAPPFSTLQVAEKAELVALSGAPKGSEALLQVRGMLLLLLLPLLLVPLLLLLPLALLLTSIAQLQAEAGLGGAHLAPADFRKCVEAAVEGKLAAVASGSGGGGAVAEGGGRLLLLDVRNRYGIT